MEMPTDAQIAAALAQQAMAAGVIENPWVANGLGPCFMPGPGGFELSKFATPGGTGPGFVLLLKLNTTAGVIGMIFEPDAAQKLVDALRIGLSEVDVVTAQPSKLVVAGG